MFYNLYRACGNTLLVASLWGNFEWQKDKNFRRILSKISNGEKFDSILVLRGNPWNFSKQNYHCFMDVFEPRVDSVSTMCGNGIRAVCKYWIDSGFVPDDGKFLINTRSGVREVNVLKNSLFRVNMGYLSLDPRDLKKYVRSRSLSIPSIVGVNETIIGITGNRINGRMDGEPHLIFFLNKMGLPMKRLNNIVTRLGRIYTKNRGCFPNEINTSIVTRNSDGSLSICTYERGVYYVTKSCGTAVSVAAGYFLSKTGDRNIIVNTLGGKLTIERDDRGVIYLTGDARF